MARFRKKPVEIEARYFDGSYQSGAAILDWADASVQRADLVGLRIQTLNGPISVLPGEWVIRGVQGEFYPCRSDIFEQTYEPVDTADASS